MPQHRRISRAKFSATNRLVGLETFESLGDGELSNEIVDIIAIKSSGRAFESLGMVIRAVREPPW